MFFTSFSEAKITENNSTLRKAFSTKEAIMLKKVMLLLE